jgi:excinuclease ABC subunit A
MPIEEAADFFAAIPSIARYLRTLSEVGLGYVRLGQPATTLSGGEAQRVKLASELQRRSTGRTVYVLDEPTTGLHFEDIRKLLLVLQGLVDQGNTGIGIEHNLDVVKSADWIVDMGPEGGSGGGMVVSQGTPEQVAADAGSYTGQFLAPVLAGHPAVPVGVLPPPSDEVAPKGKAAQRSSRAGAGASRASGGRAARSATTSGRRSAARTKSSGTPARQSA